jgi:hypothetical protein
MYPAVGRDFKDLPLGHGPYRHAAAASSATSAATATAAALLSGAVG